MKVDPPVTWTRRISSIVHHLLFAVIYIEINQFLYESLEKIENENIKFLGKE